MKNAVYWISLQSALGFSSPYLLKILEHYDTIVDFFNAGEKQWRKLGFLTPAVLVKLKAVDFEKAQRIVESCEQKQYSIITPEDEGYPSQFFSIYNPPAVLYVNGNLSAINDEVTIGMVGTRKSTQNGNIIASVLAYRLAQAGAVIISGGALGIDSACSTGTLAANGKCIIVLGCGLSYPYLMKNKELRDEVAKSGAVITEYPPDFAPSNFTFPERNRLISALSLGVAVIEAPNKSGALITARHALEQGKDVFTVPGDIVSKNYIGNNKLLQDGATAIYTPGDVLLEYHSSYPNRLDLKNAMNPICEDKLFLKIYNKYNQNKDKSIKKNKKVNNKNCLKGEEQFKLKPLSFKADEDIIKVYNCFSSELITVDMIVEKCGLNAKIVLSALTELEMNGAVELKNGGFYQAII